MIAGESSARTHYEIVGVCGRTNEITVIDVDELARLRARVAELEGALREYGAHRNWTRCGRAWIFHSIWATGEKQPGWSIARAALEEEGDK